MKKRFFYCFLFLYIVSTPYTIDAEKSDFTLPKKNEDYYQSTGELWDYDDIVDYKDVDSESNEFVQDPSDIKVLCNKYFRLPSDYVPEDLASVDGSYKLRSEAAKYYNEMKSDAKREGMRFVVYSAYRSYDRQKELYNSYTEKDGQAVADTYSAKPGHSEHQTGLAVDLLHKSGYSTLSKANFQNTKEYRWLLENAHKYGFILRYPEEYIDITGYIYEPWHWRYVGTEIASVIHDEAITTYEEYCDLYL